MRPTVLIFMSRDFSCVPQTNGWLMFKVQTLTFGSSSNFSEATAVVYSPP